jgi:DNA-directed RNA polymerase specialized sigma24 family protein
VALEAWARWAKRVLGNLGWPAWTIVARIIEFGVYGAAARTGQGAQFEADQLCEMVERIVIRLREMDRRVIALQYLHWQPIEVSAQLCAMTAENFRASLCRARREVGHCLQGARIALQQNTP